MANGPAVPIERVPIDAGERVPGGQVNAHVVGTEAAVLIDPAERTDALAAAVDSADVAHLAVTHTHPDHVGAVADFAEELDATVWARAGAADRFEATTGVAPDETFREGTTVGPTTVMETPGHASDHVGFLVGAAAVTGDLAFASGSVVIGRSGDMRAYLTSLRRLLARAPSRLYPGHGPVVEDPAATLRRLVRHRLAREALVREAVSAGAETPGEIVDRVYEGDLGRARGFAELTVEAHLRKLAVEGDVRWDGEGARPG